MSSIDSPRPGRLPLVVGTVLLVLGAVLTLWSLHASGRLAFPLTSAEADGPQPGQRLPDLTLGGLDGAPVQLASFRGSPVVVNFWATWCVPCRSEMPELESAYRSHRRDGLVVLGVNVGDDVAEVQAFRQDVGVSFPLLLDSEGEAVLLYRVTALPTTFFIDRDGTIRDIQVGAMSEKTLGLKLQKLLGP